MAKYWGLTYAQLEEEAQRVVVKMPSAPPPASLGRWGEHPSWGVELAAALAARKSKVPDRFYLELAGAVMPSREPSADLITRMAEALYFTEGVDVTTAHRHALAAAAPSSRTGKANEESVPDTKPARILARTQGRPKKR